MEWQLPIGARPDGVGVRFRVWAPDVHKVELVVLGENRRELSRHLMRRDEDGYHAVEVEGLRAGAKYMYLLDGDKMRPDPASKYQPEGVHGPSQVVDPSFSWSVSAWNGIPLEDMILYEVHTGTATPEGTFEALIDKLPYLRTLGVTAVEIMPVADFPGDRNWGYDGVDLYAPARVYGGPLSLKRLVDEAHRHDLAVVLDVVYNHLGPAGNYLRDFSRDYFTSDLKTPWGDALNFRNRHVRDFFLWNACYWAQQYNVDGLRLDATHAILDDSDDHVLKELGSRVRETLPQGRNFVIFAEDERNDVWMLRAASEGGVGIDAVWADDFHHEVRSAVAGDNEGYYVDYTGSAADIAETLNTGWFYRGQVSTHAGAPRGTDASDYPQSRFVYCIQNHDQIGNRAFGDRLNMAIEPCAYRAASALLLLSPYTPLLFQGQEWAAGTPFLFFTDHDAELGKMVTEGRRAEFAHFKGFEGEDVPDPQDPGTFLESKLKWDEVKTDAHPQVLELYRELLSLRRSAPAMKQRTRRNFSAEAVGEHTVITRQRAESGQHLLVITCLKGGMEIDLAALEITRLPEGGTWEAALHTEEPRFGGSVPSADVERMIAEGRLRLAGPGAVALQAMQSKRE
jgi:maltooligosyltrehalose trehalohydrolase